MLSTAAPDRAAQPAWAGPLCVCVCVCMCARARVRACSPLANTNSAYTQPEHRDTRRRHQLWTQMARAGGRGGAGSMGAAGGGGPRPHLRRKRRRIPRAAPRGATPRCAHAPAAPRPPPTDSAAAGSTPCRAARGAGLAGRAQRAGAGAPRPPHRSRGCRRVPIRRVATGDATHPRTPRQRHSAAVSGGRSCACPLRASRRARQASPCESPLVDRHGFVPAEKKIQEPQFVIK